MPHNMIAVVTTPVHDIEEEEFQLSKIREMLGPDYTVLAGVETPDAAA